RESAAILQGPVVATPILAWSKKDLAIAPPPASVASLNLRMAPSASPAVRSACPSSIGIIHFGFSAGGGDVGAEALGRGAEALAVVAVRALGSGRAAMICGRTIFVYPSQPAAPMPPRATRVKKTRPVRL